MKPIHQKILDKLSELCEKHTQLRFGQMLFNYTKIGTFANEFGAVIDPFNYQDQEFLDSIKDIENNEKEVD